MKRYQADEEIEAERELAKKLQPLLERQVRPVLYVSVAVWSQSVVCAGSRPHSSPRAPGAACLITATASC